MVNSGLGWWWLGRGGREHSDISPCRQTGRQTGCSSLVKTLLDCWVCLLRMSGGIVLRFF